MVEYLGDEATEGVGYLIFLLDLASTPIANDSEVQPLDEHNYCLKK